MTDGHEQRSRGRTETGILRKAGAERVRREDEDKDGRVGRAGHVVTEAGLVHLGCYNQNITDWVAHKQ